MEYNTIILGHTLDVLRGMPDSIVDCCITSPPYWGLRKYNTVPQIWLDDAFGWVGELGNEPTFYMFIGHLIQIFDEVKRVLKPTGTCFVNLGDGYNANYRGGGVENASSIQKGNFGTVDFMGKQAPDRCGIPAKSLCCIPDRFKIAMVDRGWICRNEIIWHKRNCMPTSADDRFTTDFEKIFFFTKNQKYYFEQQFEPITIASLKRERRGMGNNKYAGDEHKSEGVHANTMSQPRKHKGYEGLDEEFKTAWEGFRKVVGKSEISYPKADNSMAESSYGISGGKLANGNTAERIKMDINIPKTSLATKYDGYKYSVATLKQTNETILVFQKPYKTGSCLHDIIAMEGGDIEITCGALDIDAGRVATSEDLAKNYKSVRRSDDVMGERVGKFGFRQGKDSECEAPEGISAGRYPSQTFIECICDKVETEPTTVTEPTEVKGGIWQKSQGKPAGRTYRGGNQTHINPNCPCAILDRQSGESNSSGGKSGHTGAYQGGYKEEYYKGAKPGFGDTGGCSKVLHHCKYEEGDFDIYNYCPKVGKKERDAGMEGAEDKVLARSGGAQVAEKKGESEYLQNHIGLNKITVVKNNHPTVKPIALIQRILTLFETPNRQVVLDPFIGSGTTGIVCKRLDMDYIGVEINPDYVEIARKRIDSALSQPEKAVEVEDDRQMKLFE